MGNSVLFILYWVLITCILREKLQAMAVWTSMSKYENEEDVFQILCTQGSVVKLASARSATEDGSCIDSGRDYKTFTDLCDGQESCNFTGNKHYHCCKTSQCRWSLSWNCDIAMEVKFYVAKIGIEEDVFAFGCLKELVVKVTKARSQNNSCDAEAKDSITLTDLCNGKVGCKIMEKEDFYCCQTSQCRLNLSWNCVIVETTTTITSTTPATIDKPTTTTTSTASATAEDSAGQNVTQIGASMNKSGSNSINYSFTPMFKLCCIIISVFVAV